MRVETEINRTIRRTRSYWYEDGLVELAAGAIFLLVGLLFYVEATAPAGGALAGLSALGLPLILIGGFAVAGAVVRKLKAQITYPRTGYVAYPRPKRRLNGLAFAAGAVLSALVIALVLSQPLSLNLIPALQGLVIGAACAWLGRTLGLGRFYAIALASLAAGLSATYLGLGDVLGSAAYFGVMGITLGVSGAFTLASYLRLAQPTES